jgi:hypothetical protein
MLASPDGSNRLLPANAKEVIGGRGRKRRTKKENNTHPMCISHQPFWVGISDNKY